MCRANVEFDNKQYCDNSYSRYIKQNQFTKVRWPKVIMRRYWYT